MYKSYLSSRTIPAVQLLPAPGAALDRPKSIDLRRKAKRLVALLYTCKSYKCRRSVTVNVTAMKMIRRLCISGENV